jgi:hypothetical protein
VSDVYVPSDVRPPSLTKFLRGHGRSIATIERGQPGAWHYVRPVAPATVPDDYVDPDPLASDFVNGWGNVTGQMPFSYRVFPATKVEFRGVIQGGDLGTVVTTVPAAFRPVVASHAALVTSGDGLSLFGVIVSTTGDVTVVSEAPIS